MVTNRSRIELERRPLEAMTMKAASGTNHTSHRPRRAAACKAFSAICANAARTRECGAGDRGREGRRKQPHHRRPNRRDEDQEFGSSTLLPPFCAS